MKNFTDRFIDKAEIQAYIEQGFKLHGYIGKMGEGLFLVEITGAKMKKAMCEQPNFCGLDGRIFEADKSIYFGAM